MGEAFRAWILAQTIEGCSVFAEDGTHLRIQSDVARGEVNFYVLDVDTEVVEMSISRASDGGQAFFLHFMMDDLMRAKELFAEMTEALLELGSQDVTHVLLCCSCGATTNLFATRMNEISHTLSLGYEFEAKPLDLAVFEGGDYAAVMLAPQAAYLRGEVARSFPQAAVFEIPAKVFGAFDAPGGVRLVSHVLDRVNTKSVVSSGATDAFIPTGEGLVWEGRVMVVSAILGARLSTYIYRVYDRGELVLEGKAEKRAFDFRDIEDLLAGVRLRGVEVGELDAIGVAVPGIIDDGAVSLLTYGIYDYALRRHLERTYGTKVFLDNDANAAAAGVFATQQTYQSITYHREDFGHAGCGQGSVVNGRIVSGRKNFAGELNHLVGAMRYDSDPDDMAWTEDGLRQLVSRFLLANICTLAPEAIYVDAWPVTDMGPLREELLLFLPAEYIPELIPAPDFTECTLLGELALCVQRLRSS